MPELPEVETIARYLRNGHGDEPSILGEVVTNAEVFHPKTLANIDAIEFFDALREQRVQSVGRRGKFLRIFFDRAQLVIHLRMSGDIRVESEAQPQGQRKHDRMCVNFISGKRMVLNDTRKFARCWFLPKDADVPGFLGPEPMDESLTVADFSERVTRFRRAIKAVLLDQAVLAGVGNIYSDEALFRAKIDPRRQASSLSLTETTELLESVRAVLQQGILSHGASIDWVYRGGDFQNEFNVYQRTGSPCKVCGHVIERTVVAQRGTHYCPNCQK